MIQRAVPRRMPAAPTGHPQSPAEPLTASQLETIFSAAAAVVVVVVVVEAAEEAEGLEIL